MNEIESVSKVAQGIGDVGMMAMAAAFFLVLAAGLMWSCFGWFKNIINGMIESNKQSMADLQNETRQQNLLLTDIAEGLRQETKLRIKHLTSAYFDLSIEKVSKLIKQVRKENHIADHDATSFKIRKSLSVMHYDRNSKFDSFTYRGKRLSLYCNVKWIDAVADVVEGEIYNVDGENDTRAYNNVELAYNNIKTEFYENMEK